LGFACGAFASFTPFFTLHALVAAVAAWFSRANIIASVFGTVVGNPLSFPLIATICLGLGNWILGRAEDGDAEAKMTFAYLTEHPVDFVESIFTPYLVGGLAPGLACGVAFYVFLRPLVAGFQKRRRDALERRARAWRRDAEPPRAGARDAPPEPRPAGRADAPEIVKALASVRQAAPRAAAGPAPGPSSTHADGDPAPAANGAAKPH
ncbi:MAG: DUF2062 domain-containing protein, partial [Pseudomonadota bacterium]